MADAQAMVSRRGVMKMLKNVSDLSKSRLTSFVVLSAWAGYIATGVPVSLLEMACVCLGTGLASASANTFNQIYEIEKDRAMRRTRTRPLPSGRISKTNAIIWGLSSGASGCAILLAGTNPLAASLALGNIVLYAALYTPSKAYTEINTWIGSVVGAIPPLIGWAAGSPGDLLSVDPFMLGGILYLWQFPHFFALSWLHREDYRRGGFRMVSVSDADGLRTSRLITRYCYYLSLLPIATVAANVTSAVFLLESILLNGYLVSLSRRFAADRTEANARKVFKGTLLYLPLVLAGFLLHRKKRDDEDDRTGLGYLQKMFHPACIHHAVTSESNKKYCVAQLGKSNSSSSTDSSHDRRDSCM